MEPYIDHQFQHHQSQQSNPGLLRFRSAPSSLLSSFKGYDFNQSPAAESHQSVLRFLSTGAGEDGDGDDSSPSSCKGRGESKQSMQEKVVGGGPKLFRQSSSPHGFLSQLNAHNGYGMMRGIGNLRAANGAGGESSPRSSRLRPQIDFPPGIGRLPRIPEIAAETTKESSSLDEGGHNHACRNGEDDASRLYSPSGGLAFASWNDPSSISEGSSGFKGHQQNDKVLYSGLDASPSLQNDNLLHRTHMLSHHLSLPKTSAEMAAVEKLLNFQDTVPCKIRAKRGCATHPRSIAERVRRTRISERMKKLQDLVPNMDKQMNTADMLDLAVEYIKDLQKQYKTLSDNRARCQCIQLQQSAADKIS